MGCVTEDNKACFESTILAGGAEDSLESTASLYAAQDLGPSGENDRDSTPTTVLVLVWDLDTYGTSPYVNSVVLDCLMVPHFLRIQPLVSRRLY